MLVDPVSSEVQAMLSQVHSASHFQPRPPRPQPGPPDARIHAIEFAVSVVFNVERTMIARPTRGPSPAAHARQIAMYLAHVLLGLTLTQVGRAFGRDRTTVAHACAVIEDARDDPRFDRTMELIEGIVRRIAGLAEKLLAA